MKEVKPSPRRGELETEVRRSTEENGTASRSALHHEIEYRPSPESPCGIGASKHQASVCQHADAEPGLILHGRVSRHLHFFASAQPFLAQSRPIHRQLTVAEHHSPGLLAISF